MKTKISDALKDAMRARDSVALSALRGLSAAIKNIEIDKQTQLEDGAVVTVVRSQIKQIEETIAGFDAAGRGDETADEHRKVELLKVFLPVGLSDEALGAIVAAAVASTGAESMRDMGKVMGVVKAEVAGRADGGAIAGLVKAALS
jgi:uncharacterized protein YqeY